MSDSTGADDSNSVQSNLTCSFERSVKAADTTLKKLTTTKEAFSDFEAFYKKFAVELNEVREKHRLELYKCQSRIDDLLKKKTALEEQLRISDKQTKKYKEELSGIKRKQAEREWENEKQARELSFLKAATERLKTEKDNLEQEVASLRQKLANTNHLSSLTQVSDDGEHSVLDITKEEVEQLEGRYRLAMEEKEALHVDIVILHKHMTDLQAEHKKIEQQLQTQTQDANVKVYKAEMQLKNITRQKEKLAVQLEECQRELKKTKDHCLTLERQKFECQEMAETYEDEINIKRRQIETLNDLNKTLENKIDVMSSELQCAPEVSSTLLASQDESFIQDLQLSESKLQDLETSLQSTRNEKQNLERDMTITRNKLTVLEESNQRSQEKIRKLERQAAVARDNAAELNTEIFTKMNQCSQLQTELNELRTQKQDLASQLVSSNYRNSEMEKKLAEVFEEKDELKQSLLLADKKVADITELVKRTENSNNLLEEKNTGLKNQLLKLEGQNESNSRQIAKLKMELETERSNKEKIQKELLVAKSRVDDTQRSLERAKREHEIKRKFTDELKKTNKSNEEKIQSLNEKLGKLQAKLEVMEEEKRDLHEEALNSQNCIKELEADNNLCAEEKDRLDVEIQELYKKINVLQSNVNVCEHERLECEHQVALLKQKVKKYEAELAEIMKNNTDLEVKIQDAISSTCRSNDEIAALRKQVEEYKHAADEIRKEVTKKDKLLEQLREKIMSHTVYSAESIQDELAETKSLLEKRDKEKKKLEEKLFLITEELKQVKERENLATKRKEQLESEVEMLREKLSVVSKTRDVNLAKELEYERVKARNNSKELASLRLKLDSLESETDISRKDVHAVNKDLQVAEETILNLSCNLERSLEERKDEIQRFYLLENKLKDMGKDLKLSQTLREEADEEVRASNKKIAKLESTMDALEESRNLIKDKLDTANDNLMDKKEEIIRLKAKITEQDKTNEYLNQVITKKDHAIHESRDRVRICEADLEEVRRQLTNHKVTCEGLKADNKEHEQRCLMYQEKIKGIENELLKQREVKNATSRDLCAQKLQVDNLQNKIKSLVKKKDHYKNEYENAQSSIRKAKTDLTAARLQMRENETFLETNSMNLKEKENTITRLKESKIALENELTLLKADMETLRRNFEQSEDQMKAELEQSSKDASIGTLQTSDALFDTVESDTSILKNVKLDETSMQKISTLDKEKSFKERVNKYQREITAKEREIKSLNQRIFEMGNDKEELKRVIDSLEASNKKLEEEKRELRRELLDVNGRISDLEVKLDYERQEKALVDSLLSDSRKTTNEMQGNILKVQQELVELQSMNEQLRQELKERDDIIQQEKRDKSCLEEDNVVRASKNIQKENALNEKKISDLEESRDLDHENEIGSAANVDASKWQLVLYDKADKRKSEPEEEIANIQKDYGSMKSLHKDTMSELDSTKEGLKTMKNRVSFLELQLGKDVEMKDGLEKPGQEREKKLGLLKDEVSKAYLKLVEARREPQRKSKCLETEVMEREEQLEHCSSPLLQNTEKLLAKSGGESGSKEILSPIEVTKHQEEGQVKREEEKQLTTEVKELRLKNEELKKEIYHLQAKQALGEIQKASYENVLLKHKRNEIQDEKMKSVEMENDGMESQEGNLATINMLYNILIDDILKLGEELQNYQMNVLEWESSHDSIEIANERLVSYFSALQALFSDLDAGYEKLNCKKNTSDSNGGSITGAIKSNKVASGRKVWAQKFSNNTDKMNGDSQNEPQDDNTGANVRERVNRLEKDNMKLKEENDKLMGTVTELEKKVEYSQEASRAPEISITTPIENVIQLQQEIKLNAVCTSNDDACWTGQEDVSNEDVTSKQNDVTSDVDVTSKVDATSRHRQYETSEDDATSKQDLTRKNDVTSKIDVRSKQDSMTKTQEINELKSVNELCPKENVDIAEENSIQEEISTAQQLNHQEEANAIAGKLTPNHNFEILQPGENTSHINDMEEKAPEEDYLAKQNKELFKELEKSPKVLGLEKQLSCAKQRIEELESQLQKDSRINDDNANKSADDDKSDKSAQKEKYEVDGNVGENIMDRKDVIQELQEQNKDLKTQVKQYKDYNERVNAMIATLRMQVARLQNELEKYKRENPFDFGTRSNQKNGTKDFANPKSRGFSESTGKFSTFLHSPVRLRDKRTTTLPSFNSMVGGLRASSTPNLTRMADFDKVFLPEISSLNLSDDAVLVPHEDAEKASKSATANDTQCFSPRKEEHALEKCDGFGEEDKLDLIGGVCLKDNNEKDNWEHEQENEVKGTQNGGYDKKEEEKGGDGEVKQGVRDGTTETETKIYKFDLNENYILEDKDVKTKQDDIAVGEDLRNKEKESANAGSTIPPYERPVVDRSRDQQIRTNSPRSVSIPRVSNNRSGVGIIPVYTGQRNGRSSYHVNKVASLTYPFTRKYC